MQPIDTNDEPDLETGTFHRIRHRLALALMLLLAVLLLAFIPPLINVSRFQRRVDRNISASLGRPVHFDKLSLNLLPMPGFTLDNFVIDEDPEFGSEPALRSPQVNVTLRISSLWSRHVEFSKISLTDPSVNLVHLANGRWNLESLLLQASQIETAPTAQRFAGPEPRFPYVEATGARLNLKLGQAKTPISLTEADFALWLPEPHQWHLRLEAHPIRTDTSPGETGTIRAEGTLGGGASHAAQPIPSLAQIPVDLHGEWLDAQFGGLSQLLFAHDAGLRGDLTIGFKILGTIEHNALSTRITVDNARRAEFIPGHPLSFQIGCDAIAQNTFRSFTSIVCHWPPPDSSGQSTLILTANLPDARSLNSASLQVTIPALPVSSLLDWLQVATRHPPTGLLPTGILAGTLNWNQVRAAPPASPSRQAQQKPAPESASPPSWTGELELSNGALALDQANSGPVPLADVVLRSTPVPAPPAHSRHHPADVPSSTSFIPDSFDLLPIPLTLGGKEPAILEGHLNASGYTLHISGNATPTDVVALGKAIPQLGDGLDPCIPHPETPLSAAGRRTAISLRGGARGSVTEPDPTTPDADEPAAQPVHLDLTATRSWGGRQTWCPAPPASPLPAPSPR